MLRSLIVADGDVPSRAVVERLLGLRPGAGEHLLVVAADGGALKAEAIGLTPALVIGDADSLAAHDLDRLRAAGAEVSIHPVAKDQSDTELALRAAVDRGATTVLIVGGFGGRRLEHTLANVLLLAAPDLAGLDVRLADEHTTVRVLRGPAQLAITGAVGDFVSLLPLSERAAGVTTEGLVFELHQADLSLGPSRGLSNEMSGSGASVALADGVLAVIHTRAEGERS